MAITQGFTTYFSNRQYMVTTLTDLMKAAMWRWEVPHANGKVRHLHNNFKVSWVWVL